MHACVYAELLNNHLFYPDPQTYVGHITLKAIYRCKSVT